MAGAGLKPAGLQEGIGKRQRSDLRTTALGLLACDEERVDQNRHDHAHDTNHGNPENLARLVFLLGEAFARGVEAAARAFATFVNGPQGRQIMRKYGLILPGEEPVQ